MPLATFLVGVATVLVAAFVQHVHRLTAGEALALLADGDCDGAERTWTLQVLVDQGLAADNPRDRWAAVLASVALASRRDYDRLARQFGIGIAASELPGKADRGWLGLGDDRIANLAAAMWADAEGDRASAVRRWRQVQAECQLAPNAVATALAEQALARLR